MEELTDFSNESFLNVGGQNVEAAKMAGIPVVQSDTGGEPGRKIYFNTQTGKVLIQRINYTVPVLK